MTELLKNLLNLEILERICHGTGVELNISNLATSLKKHRNTIRSHVNELFESGVLNEPIYPFPWMYQEYPLLVISRADLPKTEAINRFLMEDEHIMSAYYVRDEEFNTLLIEYHKDLHSYGGWRKKIVDDKKIPSRENRIPPDSLFFDVRHFIKYKPNAAIRVIEDKYKKGEDISINGYKMCDVCFGILKKLVQGEGIRTNENMLAKDLSVHRKTIERRISAMLVAGIIGKPMCRFPNLFVAPGQILVYYLLEIKKGYKDIIRAIRADPHIPLAVEASVKRYNVLLFGVFFSVEEHFKWEEMYDERFPGALGGMKKIYLSPKMSTPIDFRKIPMSIIRDQKEILYGRMPSEAATDPSLP